MRSVNRRGIAKIYPTPRRRLVVFRVRMTRAALLLLVTAWAACTGGGSKAVVPATVPVEPIAKPVDPPAPPADPFLAARRAYVNPGGMWMPQQMTLPGHAEAF